MTEKRETEKMQRNTGWQTTCHATDGKKRITVTKTKAVQMMQIIKVKKQYREAVGWRMNRNHRKGKTARFGCHNKEANEALWGPANKDIKYGRNRFFVRLSYTIQSY